MNTVEKGWSKSSNAVRWPDNSPSTGENLSIARNWNIHNLAFRKWPLPVVHAMGETGDRFSGLRERPPRVRYLPTGRARQLLPPLRALGSRVA